MQDVYQPCTGGSHIVCSVFSSCRHSLSSWNMCVAICKRHRAASTQRQAESQESLQPEDDVSEWRWELGGPGGVAEGGAVENIKWRLKWTETSSSSQLLGPGGWCDCAGVLVRSYSTQNIKIFLKTGGGVGGLSKSSKGSMSNRSIGAKLHHFSPDRPLQGLSVYVRRINFFFS